MPRPLDSRARPRLLPVVALALLAFGASTVARAQAPAAAPDCHDLVTLPPVGHWAEWRSSPGQTGSVRLAVLGQEVRQGRTFVRSEMKVIDRARIMLIQSLSTVDDPVIVEDVIVKRDTEPAMRLPEEMRRLAGAAAQGNPGRTACTGGLVFVGPESVTVPAGTFATFKYREPKGGFFWFSKDVPFGLVKGQSDAGEELVLAAHGADATSEITETPVEPPRR